MFGRCSYTSGSASELAAWAFELFAWFGYDGAQGWFRAIEVLNRAFDRDKVRGFFFGSGKSMSSDMEAFLCTVFVKAS